MIATPVFQVGKSCRRGGTPRRPWGLRFHQITRPLIELRRIIRHTSKIAIWFSEPKSLPSCSITLPTTATGVFTVAVFADDPRNDATLHVDQYTGQVLADVRWQHYGPVARATEMGVMLHEGKLFGSLNQIAILVVCLMILLSSVSGLVIWWKRRPQGRLGVPPLRHDLPTWKTGVVIMLALAIVFPLVAASLVAVWVLDRLLLLIRNKRPREHLS